jgi:hypothetical protein
MARDLVGDGRVRVEAGADEGQVPAIELDELGSSGGEGSSDGEGSSSGSASASGNGSSCATAEDAATDADDGSGGESMPAERSKT